MSEQKELPRVNFRIIEEWAMECPECYFDQEAPFNKANPMEPMKVECDECGAKFILTYERED